jgi:hypothetical protein
MADRTTGSDSVSLVADCSRCAALCCVAFHFDKGDEFAYNKDADAPCLHLSARHSCTIHSMLEEQGFSGCVAFDCKGAGQRVTQEVFGGRSWRDDPGIAPTMFEAFRIMRRVHQNLDYLEMVAELPLTAEQEARRVDLLHQLSPEGGWTVETLQNYQHGPLPRAVAGFLASLKDAAAGLRHR